MSESGNETASGFPELEKRVLERWRERDVFAESLRRRAGAPRWVFYEGPPTANGRPGSHHVLARVFKDIYPRFKTMRGHLVERKGGWDCHGLPVEIGVEKELGLKNKADIEAYGIAEFNARCRESVFEYVEDWNELTERIGFWIDLGDAYRTLDPSFVESCWWALRKIADDGRLFEGHKVVPYCTRCGTTLSSHELGQPDVYRDREDPSVYVRLPVRDDHGPLTQADELIVWTTTPWTLVSNAAVAVSPELTYVRIEPEGENDEGRPMIVAEAAVPRLFGEDGAARITARFAGSELVGAAYEPPFPFLAGSEWGPKGHTVLAAGFVSPEDGTGLVHTAIAFGEDDFQLGQANGLAVVNPVRLDGTFDERIGPFAGRYVKDADDDLIADLDARGRILKAGRLLHSYPHCWRCGTPLIYYAKPSWYIRTSEIRGDLSANNETVNWYPEHVKHGRFGDWIANNVDWALSRERYWGTPLPVWRCAEDSAHIHVIGSFAELEDLAGTELPDPHRPFVDELTFACTHEGCAGEMHRVPEVIDVWFDSGAMPFAQYHAPFENEDVFRERFPADFICEALDQTRGWFYSLMAVSTLVHGVAPYRNVVCLGLIFDEQGRKMSKSLGNTVDPWDVLDRYGADAFRWYLFTSKQPWDGYRFRAETIGDSVRLFLRQLWNVYEFFRVYRVEAGADTGESELDRWLRSRTAATVATVTERLEDFDSTTAGRAIAELVDDLSNWYVRRSRRRFWDGDETAFTVLRETLVTIAKLLAPFTPFVADEIYEGLDGSEPSVHLCDWPEPGVRDLELERAMAVARDAVRLGLAARAQGKLKLRQPLHRAIVVAAGDERAQLERLGEIVREELNVKQLEFADHADDLGSYAVKPNYRTLGSRFGKQMPIVAEAVAGLDPARAAGAVREGGEVAISVGGDEHLLRPDDLLLSLLPLEGFQLEREGSSAVALELELDDELRREGLSREVVHAVQAARKAAGLEVSDRIALALSGDAELLEAARAHEAYVTGETLALEVSYDDGAASADPVRVDGRELGISVRRIDAPVPS